MTHVASTYSTGGVMEDNVEEVVATGGVMEATVALRR